MRGGLRFIRDKQGLKAIIEHMDGFDAGYESATTE